MKANYYTSFYYSKKNKQMEQREMPVGSHRRKALEECTNILRQHNLSGIVFIADIEDENIVSSMTKYSPISDRIAPTSIESGEDVLNTLALIGTFKNRLRKEANELEYIEQKIGRGIKLDFKLD